MNRFFIKLKWKMLGKESLTLPNGDLYIGDIIRETYIPKSWGTLTGRGVCFHANGDVYQGSFVEGVPHGKGCLRYSNGNEYNGYFLKGKCHGQGKLKYPDGSVFTCEWSSGKISDKGILRMPNGDAFEGKWKEGSKKYSGVYRFSNGDYLEGEFMNGDCRGQGTFVNTYGTYRGVFISSELMKSNLVKLDLNEGIYEGEIAPLTRTNREVQKLFGNNTYDIIIAQITGKGIFRYNDDREYSGGFKNGKYHGNGKLTYPDGTYYDGEWLNGIMNGQGEFRYSDGMKYRGEWKDDKWDGTGGLYFNDGGSALIEFKSNNIVRIIDPAAESLVMETKQVSRRKSLSHVKNAKFPGLEFSEN
jgi:hypothetical protein